MIIDDKTVDKIATLAKLQFDEAGREEMKKDMNNMLAFFEKLDEVDTDNVEPLIFMNDEVNVLRKDVAEQQREGQQSRLVRDQGLDCSCATASQWSKIRKWDPRSSWWSKGSIQAGRWGN